jgi:hypothetical protein
LVIGDIYQNNNNTVNPGLMSDSTYLASATPIELIPLNSWINIQATWNGTTLDTYINGALFDTIILRKEPITNLDSGLAYRIGGSSDGTNTTDYMIGEIGEVRIYNYAITPTQVINDYTESLSTFYRISTFISSEQYFNTCAGIVNDTIGNLYVATYDDNKIYKINQSGYGIIFVDFTIYNVIALHGITIDLYSNLYVCAANGNIYKVDINSIA